MYSVMSPAAWAFLGIFLGSILGFVAGEFVSNGKGKADESWARPLVRRFLSAVIGAVIGHLAVQSVQTFVLLDRVDGKLNQPSPYQAANDWIKGNQGPTRQLFEDSLEDLRTRLTIISSGEILIPRDEVFNVWRKGFQLMGSGDAILATNLVSEGDWSFFGPEGGGRKTQQDAIGRGVTVRRVMLADPNDASHRSGLFELAKHHLEVGVQVRELSMDWLETPAFKGWLQHLGTPDIVLFGDYFLLLTYVHPKTKSILKSELTTKKEKLATARAFYQRVWTDSKPIIGEGTGKRVGGEAK